jgi:phosphatidate cytidylyltransferase
MSDPTMPGPARADRWGDLRKRLVSACVLLTVGAAEIWLGGPTFTVFVLLLIAVMIWELATITAPEPKERTNAFGLAFLGALGLLAATVLSVDLAVPFLIIPSLAMALTPRRDKRLAVLAALAILLAGYGLVQLRTNAGTATILWLVGLVIVSDVLGYFVGRMIGGPKFWPKVSPKKTWSGTVAGWVGALLWGAVFVWFADAPAGLIWLSPIVALAGQMGDIGESWIKRRQGVKDSSRLVPGHGGVMDRFDALTGAVVAVVLLGLFINLPLPVGH